jgi:hypothetical protein
MSHIVFIEIITLQHAYCRITVTQGWSMKESQKSHNPYIFYWEVPQDGFEWIEAHEINWRRLREGSVLAPENRWLVLRSAAQKHEVLRYRPLEDETALFRMFADTPPTEEGILAFTRRYGRLGLLKHLLPKEALAFSRSDEGQKVEMQRFREGKFGPDKSVMGEDLGTWRRSIRRMRFALDLWDAIQRKDIGQLSQFILSQKQNNGSWLATYRTSKEVSDGYEAGLICDLATGVPAKVQQIIAPGEIARLALSVVQKFINEQLWAHSSPSLLYELR